MLVRSYRRPGRQAGAVDDTSRPLASFEAVGKQSSADEVDLRLAASECGSPLRKVKKS